MIAAGVAGWLAAGAVTAGGARSTTAGGGVATGWAGAVMGGGVVAVAACRAIGHGLSGCGNQQSHPQVPSPPAGTARSRRRAAMSGGGAGPPAPPPDRPDSASHCAANPPSRDPRRQRDRVSRRDVPRRSQSDRLVARANPLIGAWRRCPLSNMAAYADSRSNHCVCSLLWHSRAMSGRVRSMIRVGSSHTQPMRTVLAIMTVCLWPVHVSGYLGKLAASGAVRRMRRPAGY